MDPGPESFTEENLQCVIELSPLRQLLNQEEAETEAVCAQSGRELQFVLLNDI